MLTSPYLYYDKCPNLYALFNFLQSKPRDAKKSDANTISADAKRYIEKFQSTYAKQDVEMSSAVLHDLNQYLKQRKKLPD